MEVFLEKKYVVIIGVLIVGLVAGGAVLVWQKGLIGAAGANLGQAFGGQWMEIRPRVANSTSTAGVGNSANANIGKMSAPVIQWCAVPKGQGDMLPKAGNVGSGTVVINEIAWMGTFQSYSDEWIELKNIGNEPANLAGWQLQNKNQKIKISLGEGEILPPGGLYLLERTDDESVPGVVADKIYKGGLGNTNEALYLFDADCRLRDSVVALSKWPAGDNAAKKTMVRLPNLLWKTSAINGGTPKGENR